MFVSQVRRPAKVYRIDSLQLWLQSATTCSRSRFAVGTWRSNTASASAAASVHGNYVSAQRSRRYPASSRTGARGRSRGSRQPQEHDCSCRVCRHDVQQGSKQAGCWRGRDGAGSIGMSATKVVQTGGGRRADACTCFCPSGRQSLIE